jgi:hypothetical protein
MENSTKDKTKNKIIKVKINKKPPEQATLFSSNEVRRFVSEFVTSWIRGEIVIRFPTAAELSKKNPLAIAFPTDPSVSQELKIKEHYIDLLSICAGIKSASTAEQDKAIADVFRMLLMFRSANRIEGKIPSADLEKRVANMEEKVQSTGKLVDQITGFLFKPKEAPSEAPKP